MAVFQRVAVVGLGTIGQEIGRYLVKKGIEVYGVDIDGGAIERALHPGNFAGAYNTIDQLPDNLDAVIEASPEIADLKAQILSEISNRVGVNTYILMTSSTLPSSKYADRIHNPGRLMNWHILPDLRTRLYLDLQGPGDYTNENKLEIVAQESEALGFSVGRVKGESRGFIFNQIWHKVMIRALELYETYEHDHEGLDHSLCSYMGMPYGCFMIMDLIGYKTLENVFTIALGKDKVPKVIQEQLANHRLGLKSGKGFYSYKSTDLDGLHTEAIECTDRWKSKPVIEGVGEAMWDTIRGGAKVLLDADQEKEEITKAVRNGYPIWKDKPQKRKELMQTLFN